MDIPSRARNILGAGLMIVGLSILLWLVVSEITPPQPDESAARSTTNEAGDGELAKSVGETEPEPREQEPMGSSDVLAEATETILPLGTFPASVNAAPKKTQQAYMFASSRENHPILEAQTCYCGCDMSPVLKHQNLRDCYIKKMLPQNKVVYEEHAVICNVCLTEAWDTEEWVNQGKSAAEIKVLIDSKYGQF